MTFKIENIDFTTCVIVGTYAVNQTDVTTEWTDANFVLHKEVVRKRISGNLNLHMRNDSFTNSFKDIIKNKQRQGGYFSVTASVNNIGETKTFDAYIEANPAEDIIGSRITFDDFTVTIMEK